MHDDTLKIGRRAFEAAREAPTIVHYDACDRALRIIHETLGEAGGIALLVGPAGAGKSFVARQAARRIEDSAAVASVDADHLKPELILRKVLAQFGYVTDLESVDELLQLLNLFAVQQTRTRAAPLLVVENLDRAPPATLRALNLLATLTVQGRPALRYLLTSRRRHKKLFDSDSMAGVGERLGRVAELQPMTSREATVYLHSRLRASGARVPDDIFPVDVCERLFERADGWPGALNAAALELLGRARQLPVSVADVDGTRGAETEETAPPRLIISRNGSVVDEYTFRERKVLIGRSEFADILIKDYYTSKMHAMLVLYSDALVLLDLNSANGTLVNSVRVNSTLLANDDVISLGHHRIKVENAPQPDESRARKFKAADTKRMQTLADMRLRRQLRAVRTSKRDERSNR